MPNTYTQIHIQAVFAVKHRAALILPEWEQELHQYITGIVANQGHRLLAINGMANHLHIVFGMRPIQSLSDLMQDIKGSSSKWINENQLSKHKFEWQQGYGAFSYSLSQLSRVIAYVHDQKKHHEKRSFLEEYRDFLRKFEIDYDEKYIFTAPM